MTSPTPLCTRHPQPVRMLPQVLGRFPPPQLSGGIHSMAGTGQTVWTCPTCRQQKVTTP